eukprot:TRINITY_DN2754_c0_g3_i1.p1 TRINITY_DN2754_c0_g3~~TRINITY_DN2754_c0_g3_i1.p1  ORF type:complete len:140 (-),score=18.55 TRINITY_DN2754_c0_g3_i1:193-612(-)
MLMLVSFSFFWAVAIAAPTAMRPLMEIAPTACGSTIAAMSPGASSAGNARYGLFQEFSAAVTHGSQRSNWSFENGQTQRSYSRKKVAVNFIAIWWSIQVIGWLAALAVGSLVGWAVGQLLCCLVSRLVYRTIEKFLAWV